MIVSGERGGTEAQSESQLIQVHILLVEIFPYWCSFFHKNSPTLTFSYSSFFYLTKENEWIVCKSREWDEKKKPNEFSLFSLTSLHFAHLFRSTIGSEFDISFDLDLSLSYLFLVYTFRVSASINDPPLFFLLTWSRARARTRLEFVMLAFTCFVYQAPELKLIKKKSKNKGGGVIRCEVIELIFCFIYFFTTILFNFNFNALHETNALFFTRVRTAHETLWPCKFFPALKIPREKKNAELRERDGRVFDSTYMVMSLRNLATFLFSFVAAVFHGCVCVVCALFYFFFVFLSYSTQFFFSPFPVFILNTSE